MSDSDSDDSDYVPSGEEKNYSVEENSLDEIDETDYIQTQNNIQEQPEVEAKAVATQNVWDDFLKNVNSLTSSQQIYNNSINQLHTTKPVSNGDINWISNQDPNTKRKASTSLSPTVDESSPVEKATSSEGKTNPANALHPPQKRPNPEANFNGLTNNSPRVLTEFKSLASLRKKTKATTLDMTKDSWEQFKVEEYGNTTTKNGVTDMDIHNRGKGGYLDRMDFLSKTDNLRFEIEKNLRNSARK